MELFISIPGVLFLILFPFFSIFLILIGVWLQRYDNTISYHTPAAFSLSFLETAALRAERKGVIQTALFKLLQANIFTITGLEKYARVTCNHKKQPAHLDNGIEKALYSYVSHHPNFSCRVEQLFKLKSPLHTQIDIALKPIYTKLEKRHLRRNDRTFQKTNLIRLLVILIILAVGSLKLYFGLLYGHAVLFLLLLLIVMPIAAWVALSNIDRQTTLGKRYLSKCRTKLRLTALLENENSGIWRVAVFGASGIQSWNIFKPYNNAFTSSDKNQKSSGGGCGGVGCSGGSSSGGGGSDSSSAGCGGCGGGS